MLDYGTHGDLGKPYVTYLGGGALGNQVCWVDFNADGWFDKRFIVGEGKLEVPVSGKWTRVHGSDSNSETLLTEDGVELEFDVKSGQWKTVVLGH